MGKENPYLTEYERLTADLGTIEEKRQKFAEPLRLIYRQIALDEFGDNGILSVGIGTGQIEEMTGVNPRRFTGVDVSLDFLAQAAKRLLEATLYKGRLQKILPALPDFPVVFASDFFNCVSPTEYLEIFRSLRSKSSKVVIVNTLFPHSDFFSLARDFYRSKRVRPPGIEGWREDQRESVCQRLKEMSIVHTLNEPSLLLGDIQKYLERLLGNSLEVSPEVILRELKISTQSLAPKEFMGKPLPVEIEAFLGCFEQNMDIFRHFLEDGVSNLAHVGFEMAVLFRGSMETEYLLRLLSDAGQQVGYKIERKAISASVEGLVETQEIVQELNRAFNGWNQKIAPSLYLETEDCGCSLSINGANMRFNWPDKRVFKGVYTPYLVFS